MNNHERLLKERQRIFELLEPELGAIATEALISESWPLILHSGAGAAGLAHVVYDDEVPQDASDRTQFPTDPAPAYEGEYE